MDGIRQRPSVLEGMYSALYLFQNRYILRSQAPSIWKLSALSPAPGTPFLFEMALRWKTHLADTLEDVVGRESES